MKSIRFLITVITISFLLILSCTDTTEPDDTAYICGVVTNSLGQPVPNAKIMLSYYQDSITSRPVMYFSFSLNDSKYIKLWLTYHNISDTVKVIVDEYLEAGDYLYQWDATNLTGLVEVSNYYDFYLKIGSYISDGKYLLNMIYPDITGDDVDNFECFTITDDYGHYDFGIDKLPFSFSDNEIEVLDENGFLIDTLRVTRKVKIWAIHTDYDPVFIDSVYVNEGTKTVGNLSFD